MSKRDGSEPPGADLSTLAGPRTASLAVSAVAQERDLPCLTLVYAAGEPLPAQTTWFLYDEIRVGRAPMGPDDASVSCDRRLSRHHATLRFSDGAVLLHNESSNGTRHNGVEVESARLSDNDVLRMGDTLFVLRWAPPADQDAGVPRLLGVSPEARWLRKQLALVGPSSAWVLLLGETGTGKEVCARALHEHSGRSGPFVAVNCSSIPEALAESHLFGHKKGAFTGAERDHEGVFEQAHAGTLFLDELGELPPLIQPKLLRALDERRVTRVGDGRPREIDVRVVAATNRDLEHDVSGGAFRGDLYARLADIVLPLPPLRQRREDILLLLAHALGDDDRPLEVDLAHTLLLHHWPFNVRELFKVATELRVRGQGEVSLGLSLVASRFSSASRKQRPAPDPEGTGARPASPDDDEAAVGGTPSSAAGGRAGASAVPGRAELSALLEDSGGNIAAVARRYGRSRRQVHRWLEKHGLDLEAFRG